ncbi:MAG: hypothetical protein GQ527_09630, partial [Bacteroidales bacterium]|nr:hypothetical protein [Bacteroidales bacterium]
MRIKVFIVLLIVSFTSQVFAQQHPKRKDGSVQKETSNNDRFHPVQLLLLDEPLNLNDTSSRNICLDFLQTLAKHDLLHYSIEINSIYNACQNNPTIDTPFFIESLKSKSLLTYQQRSYNQAIIEFNTYFAIHKAYYHTDTSYAYEYSKYALSYLRLKQNSQFLSVIDTAIEIAIKKQQPYNDLGLFYSLSGRYYTSKRKLDTARILLNIAQQYIDSSANKNFYIESNLYVEFGFLELFNSNMDMALIQFNHALELLL